MPAQNECERLHVVLVATRNPLNIGAAARAMSNFGFRSLRVVNPYEVAFREARSAVGASALLAAAQEFPSVADAVADCSLVIGTTAARNRELHQPLRHLAEAARAIRWHLRSGNAALLFGSEKRGLSNDDLDHCQWVLRIPTAEQHPSMNLGQAVAVCLYEIARADVPKTAPARLAPASDLQRFSELLFDVLAASGYVKSGAAAATEAKILRLVRRLNLQHADVELWLGMLRQVAWKVHRKES